MEATAPPVGVEGAWQALLHHGAESGEAAGLSLLASRKWLHAEKEL